MTPSDFLIAGYPQNRMQAAAATSQNTGKQLTELHFFCLLKENKTEIQEEYNQVRRRST